MSSSIRRPVATASANIETTKPRTVSVTKQLRFNPTVRGIYFETHNSDQQRAWYSLAEYRLLQETLQTDVVLLRSLHRKQAKHPHVPLSATDQAALDATAVQGVEHLMSKKTFAERHRQQRAVIQAVLAEQSRSPLGRGHGSDKLALVSSALSFETRHRALADGYHCADEVR